MLIDKKGLYILETFNRFPEIIHGFSARKLGDMGFGTGDNKTVVKNRKKLARIIGFDLKRVVEAEQVHGNKTAIVGEGSLGQEIQGVDGLLTDAREVFLLIKTADCVPALFYDPVQGTVGAVHAGWKGIVARIGSETVGLMKAEFGCQSGNIWVGLGPAIDRCCYSVSEDRALRFKDFGEGVVWKKGEKWYLDLGKAFSQDLVKAGIDPGKIEVSHPCTSCQNKIFFSFRQEGQGLGGEMAAVIGMKKKT